MNYPYIFFHLLDNNISEQTLTTISMGEDIHVYQPVFSKFNLQHPCVYMYCFTIEQYNFCIAQGYTPHICFRGEDIYSSELLDKISDIYEIFWFPHKLVEDTTTLSQYLQSLQSPICISFSDIFDNQNIHAQAWLEKLHVTFNNPLYFKEKEMLEHETFHNNNIYLKQQNYESSIKSIVLGIWGDKIVSDNFTKINIKNIIKNNSCQQCEMQDYCIQRGIGYLMNDLNTCYGIRVFNK